MSSSNREVIVDKLHGALATFRRERDEVHRAKELAVERLRLVREERTVAERNVNALQEKYDHIMNSVSSNGTKDDDIEKLQVEVERLSREAKFQHGELISKREKLNQLQSSMKDEEGHRLGYLRLAREAVRKRREKVALCEASDHSNKGEESKDVEIIKKCLLQHGDELELYSKLQKLIEKNAEAVAKEAESFSQKSNLLMKRITGYNHLLNGEDIAAGNHMELIGTHQ